jgi:hypothetical protein
MVPSLSMSYNWNAPGIFTESAHVASKCIRVRRTFQLLVELPSARDRESADELLEVDRPVLVLVEHVKDVFGKLAGVTKWEELFVYPAELGLVERSRGAILTETLVPA